MQIGPKWAGLTHIFISLWLAHHGVMEVSEPDPTYLFNEIGKFQPDSTHLMLVD